MIFLFRGSHRLCEAIDDSFLLPLHTLKVGFYLPLHHFFCTLLNDYGVALVQLSGFTWWLVMVYFLDCHQRGELPMISIFQHLNQLKGTGQEHSTRLYYFSPRNKVKTIIQNNCTSLRLSRGKYIPVHNKFREGFGFLTRWSTPSKDMCTFQRSITTDEVVA